MQVKVLGPVAINPEVSIASVRKVLIKHKFRPYKMKILQELGDDDPDRRIPFCEMLTEKIQRQPSLTKNIFFSDECSFFVNKCKCNVNKQNCRY